MYAEAAIKAGKHVFVEKPHAIDPVGVRRMQAAASWPRRRDCRSSPGLQSRFHTGWQETVKRIHDGAIGDIVAMQSMFLRGPYRVYKRPDPNMTETRVPVLQLVSLPLAVGRRRAPVAGPQRRPHVLDHEGGSSEWSFGLGGRSSSFGEVYGDMFDHHTVVYEYLKGTRLYALCRTQAGCYGNCQRHHHGHQGHLPPGSSAAHRRREHLAVSRATHNNPYDAEQTALIDSVRSGKPINSGYHMAHSTMIGVLGQLACYGGEKRTFEEVNNSDLQFGPQAGRVQLRHVAAIRARRGWQLPLAASGCSSGRFVGNLS